MSNELYHYGIPGMKWGVRRKARKEAYRQVKQYERSRPMYERIVERKTYGRRGVKRMRKEAAGYVADGMSMDAALRRAKKKAITRKTISTVAKGAAIAALVMDVKFNNARGSKWVIKSAANTIKEMSSRGVLNTPYSKLF